MGHLPALAKDWEAPSLLKGDVSRCDVPTIARVWLPAFSRRYADLTFRP